MTSATHGKLAPPIYWGTVDAKRDIYHGGQAMPAYFVFVFKHHEQTTQ
jgi:hypothetical protein